MSKARCGVAGCGQPPAVNGLCSSHAQQMAKGAHYATVASQAQESAREAQNLAAQLQATQHPEPATVPPDEKRCVVYGDSSILQGDDGRCRHPRAVQHADANGELCVPHLARAAAGRLVRVVRTIWEPRSPVHRT